VKLLAISDLHLAYKSNREAFEHLGDHHEDWLILAGDVGESPDQLELALRRIVPRFARTIWTPGNHELWCPPGATTRGQARYDELVGICRDAGVLTPEDAYVEWPAEPGTFIVPMFLLFDYSFRPAEVAAERAIQWARESGVASADERWLSPDPWPSRPAWCRARCAATEARLDALPGGSRTVLVNHWPLRYDLAQPPRIPRFSLWCGTTLTEDWGRRFRARAVVSGHLHLRTTLWREGVRYEEVSLGYPRDWRRERGIDGYLRDILAEPPDPAAAAARDPFRLPPGWARGR
jgi:hypothetical protein